jgi:hypothetical protein
LPPYFRKALSDAVRAAYRTAGYSVQPKFIRDVVAGLARDITTLPLVEEAYRRTANPLFVLYAWKICHLTLVPFPPWVEEGIETALLALANADAPDIVAKALGFRPGRGARSADTQYDQYVADRRIAWQVEDEMRKSGSSKRQAAIHAVAQRSGKSFSAIYKAVHRANKPRQR